MKTLLKDMPDHMEKLDDNFTLLDKIKDCLHEKEWFLNGKEIHQRTLSSMGLTNAKDKLDAGLTSGDYTKKHRYFMFLGSKTIKQKMLNDLIYPIVEYPKGNNTRYDSSYEVNIQTHLF